MYMYVSAINMAKLCCFAFVFAVICLSLEADAQPTVDETLCGSSTLEEVANTVTVIASNQNENAEEMKDEIKDEKTLPVSGSDETNEMRLEDVVSEIKDEIKDEISNIKKMINETRLEDFVTDIKDELKDEISSIKKMIASACEKTTLEDVVKEIKDPSKQALVSALVSNCTPLLIQQNVNGSNFFNRSWAEFKVGFGDPSGNYWLGNELLSQLTVSHRYKLMFDLQSRNNSNWYWAEYSWFKVLTEADNYALLVAFYSGNAGSYDAFGDLSGTMFTTYDRDNDRYPSYNCAASSAAGGFWYNACGYCTVNAARSGGKFWWWGLPGGQHLQSTRMWLQCK